MEIPENNELINNKLHMKKYITKSWIYLLLLTVVFNSSCADPNDYKEFIKDGEISYTGKIDSIIVFSGKDRVYIEGLLRSDPKVTKCVIYWDSRNDSLVVPVERSGRTDTLKALIPLAENLYNFEFVTFDALGNKSVPVYATGRSYGDLYQKSISNRLIVSAIADQATGDVTVNWRSIDKTLGAFATDITYTDNSDKKRRVRVKIDEKESLLLDYKKGTSFNYQTLYRPDTLCIDTIVTSIETQKTAFKIDRSSWVATADTYELTGQLPKGGSPSFVLDDDPDTYWHTVHSTGTTPFPHWLAFDMGREIEVSVVELTSRHNYLNADFRDFYIEGRNSETEDWVTYGSFFLPDIKGPQQFLLSGSPKMRYLRIYQLNGGGEPHSHLAEFSVYGNYPD